MCLLIWIRVNSFLFRVILKSDGQLQISLLHICYSRKIKEVDAFNQKIIGMLSIFQSELGTIRKTITLISKLLKVKK